MRHLLLLLVATSLLAACNGRNDHTEASKILGEMKGPDVTGVDATMLKMAEDAEAKGDFRLSAQLYQQLLDKNQSNEPVKIRYGESLRRSGQTQKALSVFNSIVSQNPNNQDALEGKGLAELSLAEINAASQTLTRVMSLNPNRWRTLNAIGVLFAMRGMTSEATQYMNAALKVNPNSPAVLNNKGLVAALERNFHGALTSLSSASINARNPAQQIQADMNAALVYAISGDLQQAEQLASKHLQGPALQNNLGQYALLANDEALARTHLQMALSESKTFYEKAWNNLADLNQSSQSGQIGTEKRVEMTPPPSLGTSGSVVPQTINQQPISNKAQYTPSHTSGASVAPSPSTTPQSMPNAASTKQQSDRNGFEAFGDYISNW